MTRNDLMVLIPWAIFSVALILISIRLQISSHRSQHRPAPSAPRAEASGEEPADGPEAAPPDPVPPYRHKAASS
jgi:hypothetical protein